MKSHRTIETSLTLILMLGSLVLSGCAPEQNSIQPQIAAINSLRNQLELPKMSLEFVETSFYPNSPSAKFAGCCLSRFRMDASIMLTRSPIKWWKWMPGLYWIKFHRLPPLCQRKNFEPRHKDFSRLPYPILNPCAPTGLMRREAKLIIIFITGTDGDSADSSNPARAQIALHRTGLLFGYENTLMLNK